MNVIFFPNCLYIKTVYEDKIASYSGNKTSVKYSNYDHFKYLSMDMFIHVSTIQILRALSSQPTTMVLNTVIGSEYLSIIIICQ